MAQSYIMAHTLACRQLHPKPSRKKAIYDKQGWSFCSRHDACMSMTVSLARITKETKWDLRSFWDFTQRRTVVLSDLSRQPIASIFRLGLPDPWRWDRWGWTQMSARNYHSTLHKNPKRTLIPFTPRAEAWNKASKKLNSNEAKSPFDFTGLDTHHPLRF